VPVPAPVWLEQEALSDYQPPPSAQRAAV